MSSIPYLPSYPVILEERSAEQPRLLKGTLIFVICQLALLLALGMSPFRNFWIMLAALFPSLAISLFQPFVGLAALFAFTLFDEQVAVVGSAFTSSKFLAIFVALGFFFRCQRREYSLVPPDPITKLALAWAFFCLVSALWSHYPAFTLRRSITVLLLAGCLLMASQMINTRARLGTILVCVALSCVVGAVIMVTHPEMGSAWETMGRASLGAENANTLARSLVMGVFGAVYLIWVTRSWLFRMVMMASISITLTGILATKTRAALGCVFLGLAGGGILGLRGSFSQRILMFGTLAVCTLAGFGLVNYTGVLGEDYMERWQRLQSGTDVRTYIWKTAVGMWLNNPALGVGYGTFIEHHAVVAMEQNRYRAGTIREAHSTYVRALVETGPLGVSMLTGMIIYLVLYSFRIRPGPMANLGFAIVVSIGAMSIISTLTHLKIFWYMIAVVVAMARTIPQNEGAEAAYDGAYSELDQVPNPYAR